ncbi:hypothetical protein EHQ27_05940 [Leptospira wolffii]|uniref:hypothetical protein n=1 Tax=Leptospira wolffii TaxID=409998 RepID=UPI001083FA73|nr:hypothetical protein [Leptospira wolffii]TGK61520.1 hypothetical protein EHQ32_01265 [Leptospira wolffii]TGK70064.1 hypothetical protein EHQ35_16680 [Leptospira wolffii]TGK74995.1 hypothetical protein EHQ27_05940 [Leptospira wolffii]TGL31161.1 hypothetical protein EHQ57_07130 [Leptospira wolffii]
MTKRGNPINAKDPTGHESKEPTGGATSFFGFGKVPKQDQSPSSSFTNDDAKKQFIDILKVVKDEKGIIKRKFTTVYGIHIEFSLTISPDSVTDESLKKMQGAIIKNIIKAAADNNIAGLYINSGFRGAQDSHNGYAIDIGAIYETAPKDGNWEYPWKTGFVRSRMSTVTGTWTPTSMTKKMDSFVKSLRSYSDTQLAREPWRMSECEDTRKEIYNRENKVNDPSWTDQQLKDSYKQDYNHRRHIHYQIRAN